MVQRRAFLTPAQGEHHFVTDVHVFGIHIGHLDIEPPALVEIDDTHDRGYIRRHIEMITRDGEDVASALERHLLQRVVILAGNAHPGKGVLAGAAPEAVRTVEPHVLLLFLGEEHVGQLRPLRVLGVIRAHLLVDLIRGVEPLLAEVVRKRPGQSPLADLFGDL